MKKMLTYTFILTVTALLADSCQKIGYKEVDGVQEIKINCLSTSNDEFVINDEASYYAILDTSNCIPTDIDFTQFTLLGKYAKGTGCSIEFKRTIYMNDDDKDYLYIIKVKEKGFCKKLGESYNWVLVSKIPADYSVTFKIK